MGARAALPQGPYYMCSCRLKRNFFVRSAGEHFEYDGNDASFVRQYEEVMREVAMEGKSVPPVAEVLADIKEQLEERRRTPQEAEERASQVAARYRRLRPEVYRLDPERFLTPEFRSLVDVLQACANRPTSINACVKDLQERGLLSLVRPQLWCFSVCTDEFCNLLEEEIAHFEGSDLPKGRPNTMNRYGVVLRELGFCPSLLDPFVAQYVEPLALKLLPGCAEALDSYRAFTVKYDTREDGDRNLALHYDNAEVTLNVNIGGNWTGGQVTFFGAYGTQGVEPVSVAMARGHGVLHSGRDLHQAEPLEDGRRQNLIIWCRCSEVRNWECPMCFQHPSVVPTNEFAHEGFTVPPCELAAR